MRSDRVVPAKRKADAAHAAVSVGRAKALGDPSLGSRYPRLVTEENDASVTEDARSLLYKEYVRLSAQLNEYAASSFADFKLLAVIGAAAGLIVKLEQRLGTSSTTWLTPMLAFGTLALVAILAFRDLLKQSLMCALVPHLCALETELRKRYQLDGSHVLRVGHTLGAWYDKSRTAAKAFSLVFLLSVLVLPTIALCEAHEGWVVLAYVLCTLLVFVALARTASSVVNDMLYASIGKAVKDRRQRAAAARKRNPETP